ncbi:MAG: 3-deoxy-D-manno-octulosonic acid transferase [Terracidiphilus sp.]
MPRPRMILFFYNLALLAALAIGAPWWLWRIATTQKYREGLLERLGLIRLRITLPRVEKSAQGRTGERPLLWLHAVSVGEVLSVSRLVRDLDTALPDFQVVVSTTTRTGQALARERFGAERVFYCPLDLPWAVRKTLNALRPRLLILAETEFWPNLLSACFRRGIAVAVVNARISDRSWPRYRRLRRLWQPLLGRVSRVLAQSPADAERLRDLGCRPESIAVAGNLKFDVRPAGEAEATGLLRALAGDLRLVVAGSTLEGEEAELLAAWPRLLKADPRLVMVLAPRHPERFATVGTLLERSGFDWRRRSAWSEAEPTEPLQAGGIVLLDTLGELASVYSLAAVAFVGGSLVPAGGHNPLEPAQFGVPIVMGPDYTNFRAIVNELLAHQGLRIATREDLADTLAGLLEDRVAARAMGGRAREIFSSQAGATARSIDALRQLLSEQEEAGPPAAVAGGTERLA